MMSDRELVDEVMDSFNFNRVVDTMGFLGWKWYTNEEAVVPTVPELRKRVRRVLREALRCLNTDERVVKSIGGFVVRGTKIDNEKFIDISFEIEAWSNYL